jgi:hypothetical protein
MQAMAAETPAAPADSTAFCREEFKKQFVSNSNRKCYGGALNEIHEYQSTMESISKK